VFRTSLLSFLAAAALVVGVGCGAKVVFVGDTGEGGNGADSSNAGLNAWQAECPGFFDGAECPSSCPLFYERGVPTPGRVFCTQECIEPTPTGCPVGSLCQGDLCVLAPCSYDWVCPDAMGCTTDDTCIPGDDTPPPCTPYVADGSGCSWPCEEEVQLPDGSTLCTVRCLHTSVQRCVLGSTCRQDMPLEGTDHAACIPICYADADCPGGLRCDPLGQCSVP